MSDYITAAEATTILRDLARGREDGDGGDVWPLYDRAEDAMRQVIALDLAATLLESERAAERTRAEAAEAEVARLTTEREGLYRAASHARQERTLMAEELATVREERDALRETVADLTERMEDTHDASEVDACAAIVASVAIAAPTGGGE